MKDNNHAEHKMERILTLYTLHPFLTVPCRLSALKIAGLQAKKWEVESMLLSAVWMHNHSIFSGCFCCLSEH